MESFECEICGRKVDHLYKVEIEGSVVMVCNECKEYGKEIREEKKKGRREGVRRYISKHYNYGKDEEEVVIEGFGRKIREEIVRKGKSVEEFARELGMKESYVRRVLNEDITPTLKEARKIEHVLNIRLVERLSPNDVVGSYSYEDDKKRKRDEKEEGGLTLGDFLRDALIKKRNSR